MPNFPVREQTGNNTLFTQDTLPPTSRQNCKLFEVTVNFISRFGKLLCILLAYLIVQFTRNYMHAKTPRHADKIHNLSL